MHFRHACTARRETASKREAQHTSNAAQIQFRPNIPHLHLTLTYFTSLSSSTEIRNQANVTCSGNAALLSWYKTQPQALYFRLITLPPATFPLPSASKGRGCQKVPLTGGKASAAGPGMTQEPNAEQSASFCGCSPVVLLFSVSSSPAQVTWGSPSALSSSSGHSRANAETQKPKADVKITSGPWQFAPR